jgi:hypothetical protein
MTSEDFEDYKDQDCPTITLVYYYMPVEAIAALKPVQIDMSKAKVQSESISQGR